MNPRPKLEIRRDRIDATYGGMFGGQPDSNRVYVHGLERYYVDDREVTKAEYAAAVARTEKKTTS